MPKHTSTKWKIDGSNIVAHGKGIIAQVPTTTKGGVFEWYSNLKLIAAAPAMRAALEQIAEFAEEEGSPFALSVAKTARAALAKAEAAQ